MTSSGGRVPNGGYGWVVVASSFFVHVLSSGTIFSLSVLYVPWLEEFKASKSETAWVVSTGGAFLFGTGPLAAYLANLIGYRPVCCGGAVVAFVGLLLSSYAQSVPALIGTLGVIGGLGLGLCYLPAVATVSIYFDTKRAMAYGIACAGVGIGVILQAPFISYLEQEYGWRGALRILSANVLHIAICGLLMRPLNIIHKQEFDFQGQTTSDIQSLVSNEDLPQLISSNILEDTNITSVRIAIADEKDSEIFAEIPPKSTIDDSLERQGRRRFSHGIVLKSQRHGETVKLGLNAENSEQQREQNEKEYSGNSFASLHKKSEPLLSIRKPMYQHKMISKSVQHLKDDNIAPENGRQFSSAFELAPDKGIPRSHTRSYSGLLKPHTSWKKLDMLMAGSLHSLSILGQKDVQGSVKLLSDSDLDETEDSVETGHRKWKSSGCGQIVHSFMDFFSIMKDKAFLMIALSNFLTNLSFLMPLIYMVDRALEEGIDKYTGTILLSTNGAGNIFGRLFFAFLANCKGVDIVLLYIALVVLAGLVTCVSPAFGGNVPLHVFYAGSFGALIGGWCSVLPPTVAELMGVEKIGQSFGIACLFSGIAGALGPPLAGVVHSWTGSFTWAFILHGLFLALSGVALAPFLKGRICLKCL